MRILVSTDQSACSIEAAQAISSSGLLHAAEVRVVQVIGNHSNHSDEKSTLESINTTIKSLKENAASNREVIASIDSAVEHGQAGAKIVEASVKFDAELIVVGTHNKIGIERLMPGSVCQFVTEHSQTPVMVARNTAPNAKNNILVAVDGSEFSAAALEWLSAQEWVKQKKVVLMAVAHTLPSSINSENNPARVSEMLLQHEYEESFLNKLMEKWSEMLAQDLKREIVPFAIGEGDPSETILMAAANWPSEMIVMGSHGRTGLKKILLGSVSQAVASKAECSTLVVRGAAAARYDVARIEVQQAMALGHLLSEKPHPARVLGSITGTDFNGSMY